MMKKILIIEDEESIADLERDYLELSNFEVEVANDGEIGLKQAMEADFDLIILDLMLPGMDGFEICRHIREEKNIPIIMVSARKDDIDKIRGLGLGADDYMTKPIDTDELLARIRALSRRKGEVPIDEMKFGDLALDLHTHDLRCNGRDVHLSQKEFEVMRMLMSSTGRVVSKHDLLASIWGTEGDTSENSAEAYISFLRKKLSHLHSEVQITTLRMLGYRLEELG